MGSMVILSPTSLMSSVQARRLTPLMTIASEPQTPWTQERRSASVPSWWYFTSWMASRTLSVGSISTV